MRLNKLYPPRETLNPNVVAGTYDGAQCGPFLKRFGETNMVFAVVGPNAELSCGMRKVIKLLVDRLAPEAVRVWRLEGESGARVRAKGTISYIVRRRLAGASWRGIAAHVANRVWFANGEAPPPSNGDGPRRGFADRSVCGNAQYGDSFDDPFSQFAGRGGRRADDYDPFRL